MSLFIRLVLLVGHVDKSVNIDIKCDLNVDFLKYPYIKYNTKIL